MSSVSNHGLDFAICAGGRCQRRQVRNDIVPINIDMRNLDAANVKGKKRTRSRTPSARRSTQNWLIMRVYDRFRN